MTLAAQADTTKRCMDCGAPISRWKSKRCIPCSIIENRRRAATRHKQTAHSWRAVSRPPKRDTGGCKHHFLLPPGAGLGGSYVMVCQLCPERREVEG